MKNALFPIYKGEQLNWGLNLQCVATIYQDHLSPDHTGGWGAEKCHHLGNIRRHDQTTGWSFADLSFDHIPFLGGIEMMQGICIRDSRGYCVDVDVFISQFNCQVAGQRF